MFFILLLFTSYKEEILDCDKIKNGKFFYRPSFDRKYDSYLIIRKGAMQWEINQNTRDTSTYLVRWTSNCSYNLYFQKNSNPTINAERQATKRFPIVTEILHKTEKYYVFSAKLVNADVRLRDTLWIRK